MKLIIIAALSRNRVIGKNGKVPWNIPEDMRRFKRLTLHHTVVMGRRSYETLEEPLVHRRNVVITSRHLPGVETYSSLDDAFRRLANEEIVWIIGGGEIFSHTIEIADEWKLTHVDRVLDGDTFFPPYEHLIGTKFRIVFEEKHEGFVYRDYVKIPF
ncbi:MAG: dihydrofolate reductase [Bacteroidetes bacterium]|nr:dihydrofolate reductase [Bacteroidota bacterium]